MADLKRFQHSTAISETGIQSQDLLAWIEQEDTDKIRTDQLTSGLADIGQDFVRVDGRQQVLGKCEQGGLLLNPPGFH